MKPMNLEKAQMNYGEVGVKNPEKLPTLFMDGLFFFFLCFEQRMYKARISNKHSVVSFWFQSIKPCINLDKNIFVPLPK